MAYGTLIHHCGQSNEARTSLQIQLLTHLGAACEKNPEAGEKTVSAFLTAILIVKDKWRCKSCGDIKSFNSSRMHEHDMYECNAARVKLDKRSIKPSQEKIQFSTLSKAQHDALDNAFAAVCYEEGLPFSVFESPAMRRALRQLNPAYKHPSRKRIAGTLLDKAYTMMKSQVDEYLDSLSELNIITDESSNVNNSRIANISINTPKGSIHWLSEDLGSTQSSAANIASWLEKHLRILTHDNLERINSCANDTCSTMLSMWEHLSAKPGLRHLFVIPCDSHGIQLLIQDLISSISSFKTVHNDAQTVAKAFKNAHLQYARLRDLQLQEYR